MWFQLSDSLRGHSDMPLDTRVRITIKVREILQTNAGRHPGHFNSKVGPQGNLPKEVQFFFFRVTDFFHPLKNLVFKQRSMCYAKVLS